MSYIVMLSGSPARRSRSGHLLDLAEIRLGLAGAAPRRIDARALPPAALLAADTADASLASALALLAGASAVVLATPIYHSAYAGLLKVFLDLLPRDALAGKPVLMLASGGSQAHLLALDYTLRPVLAALGARRFADNVYACEADMASRDGAYLPSGELAARLDGAVDALLAMLADDAGRALSAARRPAPRVVFYATQP